MIPAVPVQTILILVAACCAVALVTLIQRKLRSFLLMVVFVGGILLLLQWGSGYRVVDFPAVGRWLLYHLQEFIAWLYGWVSDTFIPEVTDTMTELASGTG